jgi:hypothetical protein
MTEAQAAYLPDAIRFVAQVAKVSTLADGGIRVTLDLPETAIGAATQLMQVRQGGGLLEIAAVAIVKQESIKNDICTRSEWKPEGAA